MVGSVKKPWKEPASDDEMVKVNRKLSSCRASRGSVDIGDLQTPQFGGSGTEEKRGVRGARSVD